MRSCALVAALVAVACSKPAASRLISEQEITALEERFVAGMTASAALRCPRPPVRGVASDPGDDALRTLFADAELSACLKGVKSVPEPSAAGYERADLVAADEACGARVEALVTQVAAAGEACSPLRLGATIPVGHNHIRGVVAIMARRADARAQSGQPRAGAELLLDTLRVGQDLARRGDSWGPATALVAARELAPHVTAVLATRGLSDEDLGALAGQLDTLIASTPPAAEAIPPQALEEEEAWLTLHLGEPAPIGWWGKTVVLSAQRGDEIASLIRPVHLRDWAAARILVGEERDRLTSETCPAASTLRACVEALAAHDADWRRRWRPHNAEDLGAIMGHGADRRDKLFAALRGNALDELADEPRDVALALSWLIALRLDVEVRRRRVRGEACPAPAELATLAAPKLLGDRLTVTRGADGAYALAAPAWTDDKGEAETLLSVPCPP